jgi:type IV pilus assembly protein PilV
MIPARVKISPSGSSGFTLVEVLMAMLIMTVGFFGLLQSIQVAYQHHARNWLREEAVLLAEEQMNDFRRMKFENITASNGIASVGRIIGGANKDFTVTRQCQPLGSGSKKLSVALAWTFKNVTATHVVLSLKNQ